MKYNILVNTVNDHLRHKKTLMKLIDNFENLYNTRVSSDVAISNHTESINKNGSKRVVAKNISTDWEVPEEINRQYLDYFYNDVIEPVMNTIGIGLGFEYFDWTIKNSWFRKYSEGGEHGWHNHSNSQFTNCYYLELPDSSYKTEVLGRDGKIIEFDVKEGDVLTIPAWMKHRSPPNGKERKTVIAFNSNYQLLADNKPSI